MDLAVGLEKYNEAKYKLIMVLNVSPLLLLRSAAFVDFLYYDDSNVFPTLSTRRIKSI